MNPPSLTTALFQLPRRPNVEVADLSEAAAARELLAAGPRAGQSLAVDPTLQKGPSATSATPDQEPTGPTVTMADPDRFEPLDAVPMSRAAANVSRSLPVSDPASDFAQPGRVAQAAPLANPASDFQPVQGTPVRFGSPPSAASPSVQPVSGRPVSAPWDAAPAKSSASPATAPATADPWDEARVTIDEF